MYKLTFNILNKPYSREYETIPIDYTDGGELYYRENKQDEWKVATPPARYRARQDCYEKFGKENFLTEDKVTAKENQEMTKYFNERVKIYEEEEKVNEK